MKIVTLLENETENKKLKSIHGLSLYIEANNKKILFDTGQKDYYLKNAKKLGIDIADIDILVISHGHYDHGGGIGKFLRINKKAKVYLSSRAFEEHVKVKGQRQEYISIGIRKPLDKSRLVFIDRRTEIAPGINIYTEVSYDKQIIGDTDLKAYIDGQYVDDHFDHEIYLIIKDLSNTVLFTGCAHKGIENIVDTIEENAKIVFTHIMGGFHFSHYDSFNLKQADYLQELTEKFNKRKTTHFYAGHCTGEDAFFELKRGLREKISRFKTGTIVNI